MCPLWKPEETWTWTWTWRAVLQAGPALLLRFLLTGSPHQGLPADLQTMEAAANFPWWRVGGG